MVRTSVGRARGSTRAGTLLGMSRRSLALFFLPALLAACQAPAPSSPVSAPSSRASSASKPTASPAASQKAACLPTYGVCFTTAGGLAPVLTKTDEGPRHLEELEFRGSDGSAVLVVRGQASSPEAAVCVGDTVEVVDVEPSTLTTQRPTKVVQYLRQGDAGTWTAATVLTNNPEFGQVGVSNPCNRARTMLGTVGSGEGFSGFLVAQVVGPDADALSTRETARAALSSTPHKVAAQILASARNA